MFSNLLKNKLIELFIIKFIKDNLEENELWISKIQEIKLDIYQKGVDDGMLKNEIPENNLNIEEIFNIIRKRVKRNLSNNEILCIIQFTETIEKVYNEGFYQGANIKNNLRNY